MDATVEIHRDGRWIKAASLKALGPDRCTFDYLPDYIFSDHPVPLGLAHPVEFTVTGLLPADGGALETLDRSVPAFLYDLVPQGKGRKLLLGLLGLADSDALVMPLLLAGAFNPIGNLRIDTAVDFFQRHANRTDGPASADGFTLDDIAKKSSDFLEHLSLNAMLASGTTGVQGVAPKYLLTQDADGRWFADMALPEAQARQHWLLKLPRGRHEDDRMILRNEAAYLRVAHACGLRVEQVPMLVGEMLFVRRFDRRVTNDGLLRLHQESLASLAGLQGFGRPTTQGRLLQALRAHATNPALETVEFLKRDVLNLALRNTDNHARNTAVQRLPGGEVQLSPLFDFAPMFADPEIVPRTVHWVLPGGKTTQDWPKIIETLDVPEPELRDIAAQLRAFGDVVQALPATCKDQGVEDAVLHQCLHAMEAVATSLGRIGTEPRPAAAGA